MSDLTYGKLRRDITAIVERLHPVPRGEDCLPVSEMETALVDYAHELILAVYADVRPELERHRQEANDSARTTGRYMQLVVDMYDALCRAPHTPQVAAVLDRADGVIRESAWMSERISGTQEANRG